MIERITGIMDGRATPLGEGPPALSSNGSGWAGFLLEAHIIEAGRSEIGWAWHKTHVGVCLSGESLVRVSGGAGNVQFLTQPGSVCIFPRGCDHTNIYHSGGGYQFFVAELDSSRLNRLFPGEEQPTISVLTPRIDIDDPHIAALLHSMRAEISAGCPAGSLYGESLSLALSAYVAGRYSVPFAHTDLHTSRFSHAQLRRILEYVYANLGRDLSLVELAGIVHLSPRHFSRLFRNTFGTTPYRYVVNERVSQAKALLTAGRLSIVEIATMLGFANQSHFTDVFRRATGIPPRRFQQGH